jgi:hypothetical protein
VRLTDGQGHVAPGVKIDKVRQLVLTMGAEHAVGLCELRRFQCGKPTLIGG